jgi:hypothetical protein
MMLHQFRSLIWLCVAALLVTACANSNGPVRTSNPNGRKVAVMPLDNQTNSVSGALYMREEMVAVLRDKGYAPLPIKQTDEQLANQFGISLGGQITDVDIPKIAAALEVSALMTGTLKDFNSVLLSYNEVSASFTLYFADDWLPVWRYDNAVSVPFSPLRSDSVGTEIISGLVGSVLERTAGMPMQGAVSEYYKRLRVTLPSGR